MCNMAAAFCVKLRGKRLEQILNPRKENMQSSHIRLRARIFSILIVLASWACPVLADETGEVKALVQQSAFPQALAKADAFLQTHPGEPQMRFFKGLALTGMGKQPEAIEVFSSLAKDYPELAEPYNNL